MKYNEIAKMMEKVMKSVSGPIIGRYKIDLPDSGKVLYKNLVYGAIFRTYLKMPEGPAKARLKERIGDCFPNEGPLYEAIWTGWIVVGGERICRCVITPA
jgi:hypothetical protein